MLVPLTAISVSPKAPGKNSGCSVMLAWTVRVTSVWVPWLVTVQARDPLRTSSHS